MVEANLLGVDIFLYVVLLAFVCELLNALMGGGHGTIITPLLIILGFTPLSIVPSVLLTEIVSGFLVSLAHHKFGNVNFATNSKHLRFALLLGICSVVGVLIAVFVAVNTTMLMLEAYIAVLVIFAGILIIFASNFRFRFSWKKLVAVGTFAAFNKGISGGGYGPLVTAGQILSGLSSKEAVGISSLAKTLACVAGLTAYILLSERIDWLLAPSLVTGSILSVPFTALIVKRVEEKHLRILIGTFIIFIGLLTFAKISAAF